METKLERIAEISANSPRPEFTSLYHLINKEMSFNIIKNTLETQKNGVLIVENDVYRIKMRYIGNYREDLKNHKLNTDFLTVNSKIKQAHSVYMPTFTLMHDEVMFKIIDTGAGIFDEKSMDNMIADFTLAHRCLNDFKRIIQQYFPTE